MRCKTCNYPLWRLEARTCPECGSPFKPSDYSFKPDTVRFCCPHCRQAYYGTDPQGLIAPRAFACVKCAAPIELDQMVLLPAAGVDEVQTDRAIVPWVDRRELGLFTAFYRTMFMGMFSPQRLMEALPGDAPLGKAFLFALLTQLIFSFSCIGAFVLLIGGITLLAPGGRGGGGMAAMLTFMAVAAGFAIMIALGILVWSAIAHLTLKLTGPVAHRFPRTLQAFCYSSGGNMLIGVPCIGMQLSFVAWIWWAIAAILMLSVGQKVSGWRAALATLVTPVLAVVLAGSAAFFAINSAMQAAATAAAAAKTPGPPMATSAGSQEYAKTLAVGQAIGAFWRAQHTAPAHPLALLREGKGKLFASDFYLSGQPTGAEDGVLLGIDVRNVAGLPQAEFDGLLDRAVRTCPGPAQRLGDFVFCSGPPDDPFAEGALWLVICRPLATSPNATLSTLASGSWLVYSADGPVMEIPASQTAKELQDQNTLRASLGLAPLPDPGAVAQDPSEPSEPEATPGEPAGAPPVGPGG